MTQRLLTAAVIVAGLCIAGCKDPHESVMSDAIDNMQKTTKVLKSVTDKATAEAAVPKLRAIGDDMKKLKERAEKLGKPTADKEKSLEAKYKKPLEDAGKDMMTEMMRIGTNPTLANALGDVMKSMGGL